MRNPLTRVWCAGALALAVGGAACSTLERKGMTLAAAPPVAFEPGPSTESYSHVAENDFHRVADDPLSTFSIDVDTASYSNVRRFLRGGSLPPADAVRIEELVNYFDYSYPAAPSDQPFSMKSEVAAAPWSPEHELVQIALHGRELAPSRMPPRNLVFLLDVSGSMAAANKLPLLKRSLSELVETLGANDRVAIVVYAGAAGLVLPSTPATERSKILEALGRLEAGGSTNGGEGIELAYRTARAAFRDGGVNRVILATDGDFNVGISSEGQLVRLIEKEREAGVFLTVLGLGMGNLKDSTLEKLADKGNGNYAYLDTLSEARKVLVTQAGGTFVTIAKDVKIQVEFNPSYVSAYRLIGYENRLLAAQDFADDKKDAGEIGAGHSVTALYEVVPVGAPSSAGGVDPLKYQKPGTTTAAAGSNELMTVKLRYKEPSGSESKLLSFNVDRAHSSAPSNDFRFAAAVAGFGMLLRDSQHMGGSSFDLVSRLAEGALGDDTQGYRREFLALVATAKGLAPKATIAR